MHKTENFDMKNAAIPGFFRRLAALFYDIFMLMAIMIVAAAVVVLPYQSITGQAVPSESILYQAYLLGVWGLFFCGFWMRGGQTIGMRAWRIKVVREDGKDLLWSDAIKRFFAAGLSWLPLGLGYIRVLWDPQKRSWHDSLSATRLVSLKKRAKTEK